MKKTALGDDLIRRWEENIKADMNQDNNRLQFNVRINNNHLFKDLISQYANSKSNPCSIKESGIFPDYNATVGQNEEDYQYSFEEGYFQAIRTIMGTAVKDSDSIIYPLMFLMRQYLELSLKDAINNLIMYFGIPQEVGGQLKQIGGKNGHNLLKLLDTFEALLKENSADIIPKEFNDFISFLNCESKGGDELRYTTSRDGSFNFPIKASYSFNMVKLTQYFNLCYLYMHTLHFILNDAV